MTRPLAGCLLILACSSLATGSRADFGRAAFWFGGYAAPRAPMIGDVDADGLADFVGLYPPDGGILDVVRTSPLGKPQDMVQARRPFGADALAQACARFSGEAGAEVLVILPDGAVRVACGLDAASRTYQREEPAAMLSPERIPPRPLQAVAGDVSGDGRPDVVLLGADGSLCLLRNTWPVGSGKRFAAIPVRGSVGAISRVALGDLTRTGRASLVWLADDGALRCADCVPDPDGSARLTSPRLLAWGAPGDGLAVGRFTGGDRADILFGRRLLPGAEARQGFYVRALPGLDEARGDLAWLAGDLTGDGLDDLIRLRRAPERFTGDDVLVHAACRPGETPAIADVDNDGLRDAWETGRVKPAGLDLVQLGCSPDHRDVICEVQRIESVPEDHVRAELERAVGFYNSLPIANPDGRWGLRLHVIYREPIPTDREADGWPKLAGDFHAPERQGVTHWMLVGTGGGGQSGQMADAGSCGQHALYATFIHEFGHQLGLDHNGFWDAGWSPTYPSLLNYTYNYQLGGDGSAIRYSDGRLSSLVLDEWHLNEYLPFPREDVGFLGGPPYRFKIRPAFDGRGTLVDWNWNGAFGEENIAADINYGYSTTAGPRHKLGQARTAPALVAHGEGDTARLLLFAGDLRRDAEGKAEPSEGQPPTPATLPPLRLYLRVWEGGDPEHEGDRWSEEILIEPDGVTGDPSAAYMAGATWLAYPMADGLRLRRISLAEDGGAAIGPAQTVPDTAGARPTLVPRPGELGLLLWRSADAPVGYRAASPSGDAPLFGPEEALPVQSLVPVGAATAPDGDSLWIGLTENQDEGRPTRWQVRRLARGADGKFAEAHREWIGGEGAPHRGEERVVLLCEPNPDFADGQVCFLQCGMRSGDPPNSCHFLGMRVRNQDVHNGWLVRRYYDEWSTSNSGPGACLFRGNIAYAMRWGTTADGDGSTALHVGFFGRGLGQGKMGDFDDISFIRDLGLSHSIPCIGPS
jgi:hypothetical protein